MLIYERIYKKISSLFYPLPEIGEQHIYKSEGFMDLHVERLAENKISLTHYFKQNGDLVPDPDMEIKINDKFGTAEALTFQDQFSYMEVYPDKVHINMRAKKELNTFLLMWLDNIKKQGFKKIF